MQRPFPAAVDRGFGHRSADRCLALQLAGELSRKCRHGPPGLAGPARSPAGPAWLARPGQPGPAGRAGPAPRRGGSER